MRSNDELKRRGKALFLSNYWNYVAAAALFSVITGILIGDGASMVWSEGLRLKTSFNLLWLLVIGPLEVGVCGYLLGCRRGYAVELASIFAGFRDNVGERILAGFLVRLFALLWSLLFVVPGIVKALSYAMTPYIMVENPDMSAMEAIRSSERMMQGRKGRLFSLYLSFLGWFILSAFTGGILAVFYVEPWVKAAVTEFYEDIRSE